MLTAQPPTPKSQLGSEDDSQAGFSKWFSRVLTTLLKRENFVSNLPVLVSDAKTRLDALVAREGKPSGIFDPFDDLYRMVFQLTMRTVGAREIAESPELAARTLSLFEKLDSTASPARIIFPWLPTPNHLRRLTYGAKLYMILDKIIKDRQKEGRREQDALQFLIDSGEDITKCLTVGTKICVCKESEWLTMSRFNLVHPRSPLRRSDQERCQRGLDGPLPGRQSGALQGRARRSRRGCRLPSDVAFANRRGRSRHTVCRRLGNELSAH